MLRLVPLFLGLAGLASAQSVPGWSFDGASRPELIPAGAVAFKQPGPRRPDYPRFEQTNEAATFDGKGAHLEIKDAGANSLFDFKNGDAITLEAWVKPDGLRQGENAYVIGKGRTDPKATNPSNQNWALRLRVLYDSACLNFLFASPSGTGVNMGKKLRLKGLGTKGLNGGAQGDLYLHIQLQAHPLFKPLGQDLYFDLALTPWEAVLGAEIEIPTLEDPVILSVPAHTRNGQKLRIKSRGLGIPMGARGDLFAVVHIETPLHPSEQEMDLYQQLAKLSNVNPRTPTAQGVTP